MKKSLLLATSLLLTYNPTFAGGIDELEELIAQFGNDARVSAGPAAQNVPAINEAFSRVQDGINQIHNITELAKLAREERNDDESMQVAHALVLQDFEDRLVVAMTLLDDDPAYAATLISQIEEAKEKYLAQNPQTVISEPKVNKASTNTSSYVSVRAPIEGQKDYCLRGNRISDLFTTDNAQAYYINPAQELNNLMGRIKSHPEYEYDGEEALRIFAQTIIDPVLEQYENKIIQFTADQDEELAKAISLSMEENNKVEEPKESKVETSVVNQDAVNQDDNVNVEKLREQRLRFFSKK